MIGYARIEKLTRRLADARARAAAARQQGDDPGYHFALAEYRRLTHILAREA